MIFKVTNDPTLHFAIIFSLPKSIFLVAGSSGNVARLSLAPGTFPLQTILPILHTKPSPHDLLLGFWGRTAKISSRRCLRCAAKLALIAMEGHCLYDATVIGPRRCEKASNKRPDGEKEPPPPPFKEKCSLFPHENETPERGECASWVTESRVECCFSNDLDLISIHILSLLPGAVF